MPSVINRLLTSELTARFREMPHAILVDFRGVNARQADALRAMLQERGGGMLVVKNSLAVRALRELQRAGVARFIEGPTAFVHGGDDPVMLAKALFEWSRKERVLSVRGAMVGGQALSAKDVEGLATLPSLQVLRALVVRAIASPLSGLVGALQGILRGFPAVLKAIADKRQES